MDFEFKDSLLETDLFFFLKKRLMKPIKKRFLKVVQAECEYCQVPDHKAMTYAGPFIAVPSLFEEKW